VDEKRPVAGEVLQCFRFGEKRRRGSTCFGRGKEHRRAALGSSVEGRPEDATARRHAAGNRSQAASGLT
jgi:hypothetical protein